MQHVPNTGHIVPALHPLEKGGYGACPTPPSLWEKSEAAVWRICLLRLAIVYSKQSWPSDITNQIFVDRHYSTINPPPPPLVMMPYITPPPPTVCPL